MMTPPTMRTNEDAQRAIEHGAFRTHSADLGCAGCVELIFAIIRGYDGNTEYPTCSEALHPDVGEPVPVQRLQSSTQDEAYLEHQEWVQACVLGYVGIDDEAYQERCVPWPWLRDVPSSAIPPEWQAPEGAS